MIKKVISESKKLGVLKTDSARLLYTWFIPWLDVEGRHSADPEIIKGHLFPKIRSMTIKKIERLIQELNDGRLITLYVANGERYLQFKKTIQKIDRTREAKSIIPPPNGGNIIPAREDSGATHENSSISKDNISKLNTSKLKPNVEMLKKIIDYFNKTTNQKRSYTCEEANKLINGRLAEGRTFKDFKHVIDTKTTLWQHDAKMRIFIRPSTLFRPSHFEDYLNEPYEDPREKKPTGQLGVSRRKGPTKYPGTFLHAVYQELQKQSKELSDYSDKMFALTDEEAEEAARKFQPAEFIKFLEAKK